MVYSPTSWTNGDLITNINLNKTEEGLLFNNIVLHAIKNQDEFYIINNVTELSK